MTDTTPPATAAVRPWYQSQKVMVALIAGVALLVAVTVLAALGRITIEGTLSPDDIVNAVVWLAGLLIGGRAVEGAATALRKTPS